MRGSGQHGLRREGGRGNRSSGREGEGVVVVGGRGGRIAVVGYVEIA